MTPEDERARDGLLDRIRSLKKEIAALERQGRVEGKGSLELSHLLSPLRADLQETEAREARHRGSPSSLHP